jgi:hypothetical protein
MPELEEQGDNYSDEELESDDESEEENFLEDTNLWRSDRFEKGVSKPSRYAMHMTKLRESPEKKIHKAAGVEKAKLY